MNKRAIESILVPLSFLAFTLWYMWDTINVSLDPENLVMVLPLGLLTAALLAAILGMEIAKALKEEKIKGEVYLTPDVKRSLTGIAMFVGYILCLEPIGYDVASLVFVPCILYHFGERNIKRILVYTAVLVPSILLFFTYMLPYPIPTLAYKLFATVVD